MSVGSGLALLGGDPLSADLSAELKIDGPPGFYLATDPAAAEYFALRRVRGIILEFILSPTALGQLSGAGARWGGIPLGGLPVALPGLELLVPPSCFEEFNALRTGGEIHVDSFRRPPE